MNFSNINKEYLKLKRVLDICGALVLLIPVTAITGVCAVFIKLDDGGPIFYLADRSGKDGKPFKMIKLRSMKVNAPDLRLADGSTFNSENDERVTRFGKVARKTSLDELPQIYNVLKGDMSFIGPRPDSTFYLDYYTPEERDILLVRPGITGYNQVINRNSVGTKEKLRNDIYYVHNISFKLDLKILFKTILNVFKKQNIYRETE